MASPHLRDEPRSGAALRTKACRALLLPALALLAGCDLLQIPFGDGAPTRDRDRDGHARPADCDDRDETVHPGALDVPGDGVDQDCDGTDAGVDTETGDTVAGPVVDTDPDSDPPSPPETDPPPDSDDTAPLGRSPGLRAPQIDGCMRWPAGGTMATAWTATPLDARAPHGDPLTSSCRWQVDDDAGGWLDVPGLTGSTRPPATSRTSSPAGRAPRATASPASRCA